MSVIALIELEPTNPDAMGPYIEAAPGTIYAHGGKYLVQNGKTEVVEGGLGEYPAKVVLEFPSMAAAKGWYESPEYQAILPFRTKNSKCNFIWVEGA
jgi:uncharacterized protein (DUF1330 family)